MTLNKIIRTSVGADLSRSPPIMAFNKLTRTPQRLCWRMTVGVQRGGFGPSRATTRDRPYHAPKHCSGPFVHGRGDPLWSPSLGRTLLSTRAVIRQQSPVRLCWRMTHRMELGLMIAKTRPMLRQLDLHLRPISARFNQECHSPTKS